MSIQDRDLFICSECGCKWKTSGDNVVNEDVFSVKDANGNLLVEGDNATLIKDFKVKSSSSVLKIGTKIRIKPIVNGDHNVDYHVNKVGEVMLN